MLKQPYALTSNPLS